MLKKQDFLQKKSNLLINLIKIGIILFFAFSFTSNFIPFYEGANPFYVGASAIKFSQNEFILSNEVLKKYGTEEFNLGNWLITNENSLVTSHSTGLILLGAIFYKLGGIYGLFYLTPIFSIILLIISERISTRFFGSSAGLLTLLIIGSSNLLFRTSIELMTEPVFTVFFLLGIFFTLNFIKTKKNYQIFLASTLFVYSAWIRMTGLLAFPIEIFFVISFFLILEINKIKSKNSQITISELSINLLKKIKQKKSITIFILMCIPWICLLIGNMIFYNHFFDDPYTNYLKIGKDRNYDNEISSLIKFEQTEIDNIKIYSKYLLPYQIPAIYNSAVQNGNDFFGENWPGILGLLIIIIITGISLKIKINRIKIIFFIIFILSYVLFYSAITWEERTADNKEIPARYMIPPFVLTSFMISFLFQQMLNKIGKRKNKVLSKIFKVTICLGILIFFTIAFYYYPSIQNFQNEGIVFKNPQQFLKIYPLSLEGIEPNSIILTNNPIRILEYQGLVSFDPDPQRQTLTNSSIIILKELYDEGYQIYSFKIPFTYNSKEMKNSLNEDYGIIFKEYSETFCKIEFKIDKDDNSDSICLNSQPIRIPYFLK